MIELVCDYCGKSFERKLKDHRKIAKKNIVDKICCVDCKGLKQKEVTKYKLGNGMLTKKDVGYYSDKQNRLKELNNYIINHDTLDNLYSSEDGKNIWLHFRYYNHSIINAIEELGYDVDIILKRKPNGYYNDISNITKRIQAFIDNYTKFPTLEEMYANLGIDIRQLQKHGGLYEIKRIMNYTDNKDLRDDNGFYNASSYEYIVAQWLIRNGISYKREQYPFPLDESPYRSDFTIFDINNNPIVHIEVWGITSAHYHDVKEKKIELYNKYNLKLISIGRDLLAKNRIDYIQKYLKEQLFPYLNVELKQFDNIKILPPRDLSDEQLLNMLLSFSSDKECLPSILDLKKGRSQGYYNEVIKRYNHYDIFAEIFDKKVSRRYGYWTENTLYNAFEDLIKQGIPLNQKSFKESKYMGIYDAIKRSNLNLISMKLDFFSKIYLPLILPEYELKFINNVASNSGINIKNKVTPEHQLLAKQILDKYNNQI